MAIPRYWQPGDLGTRVQTSQPQEYVNRLLGDQATTWLIKRFAVYLVKYPSVAVTYDGVRLDPSSIIDRQTDIALDDSVGEEHGTPQVRVLEWIRDASTIRPSLVLCDENGVALHEIEDIETAGGIRFTAYVTWAGFSSYANELLLAELGHSVCARSSRRLGRPFGSTSTLETVSSESR